MYRKVSARPVRVALAPLALAALTHATNVFSQTPPAAPAPAAAPTEGSAPAPVPPAAPPAPSAQPDASTVSPPAPPSPPASSAPEAPPVAPGTGAGDGVVAAEAEPPAAVEAAPEQAPEATEYVAADEPALKAVVVTASRREESIQDVAAPVSVLGGESLINSGIGRSSKEVLDYVPNASAVTQGHGRPRWWIRGVGTGQQQLDFSNPIGFYLDDVFISNATATGFPLFDLDRVEILRGPQGTLWGKNTTGGAINVISRRPEFEPDGYLKYDYGTFNTHLLEGAAGSAVWKDQVAARISFHYEDQGGRYRNQTTHRRDGQLTDGAARLQLLWKVTPAFEALANIHVRRYTTSGSTSTVTGSGPNGEYLAGYIPSTEPRTVASNAPSNSELGQLGTTLNLKAALGDHDLVSIFGWESFTNNSLGDGDNTPLEISRSWGRARSYQLSEEIRLSSPQEQRLSWIAGLYGLVENINSSSASARLPGVDTVAPGPSNYSYSKYEHDTQSFAAFASAGLKIVDALSIKGGLRWTIEHRSLDFTRRQSSAAQFSNIGQWWEPASVSTPFDTNFTSTPEKTWNNLTGDVTPQVKITKDALAYFRYAHGVKSGGFNSSASSLAALNIVEPEVLDNFEVGAKTSFLNHRINFNASGFYYIYRDIQVNVVGPLPPTNVAVSYLQNVKQGRAFGAEFELETRPLEHVQVAGSVGLLDTKFTDFTVLNGGPSYSGNKFVRSPTVTTLLRANWDVPLGDHLPIIQLAGDWRYTSRQFHFTTNQDNPLLQSDPFSIVNLRLGIATYDEKLSLTGYVNNALNTQYLAHSLPGAQGATGAVRIPGDPITGGVFLTARWY